MDDIRTALPLLTEANAAFVQRGVSINVASRDVGNVPAVARACGCRVSPDRCQVTVYLSCAQSQSVLRAIAETRAIAAVFSRPSTHKTIQIKGSDARIGPLAVADEALIAAYRESFVEDLLGIGYARAFARAVVAGAEGPMATVTFTPNAAFDQTPGRNAGRALA
jgi:hypothetical protein